MISDSLHLSNLDPSTILCGLIFIALMIAGVLAELGLLAAMLSHPPDWRGRIRAIRERPWAWRDGIFLGGTLLGLHAILLLSIILGGFLLHDPGTQAISALLVQTVLFHGAGLFLVFALLKARRISWADAFGIRAGRVGHDILIGAVFYIAAIPIVAAAALAFRFLLHMAGYPVEPQPVVIFFSDSTSFSLRLYIIFLAVVAAPLVEEVLFRGVMLPLLLKGMHLVLAVLGLSLIFAAMHFHIPSMAPLIVIAIAFTVAYLYSGSILVPIVMHTLFNGVSVAMMILLKDSPLLQP